MAEEMAENGENEHFIPFALDKIDDFASKMQIESRYVAALEELERALVHRSDRYGLDSEEVWDSVKRIASVCNSLAMQYLQREEFSSALDLLRRAAELTEPRGYNRYDTDRLRIRAITLNNLGCLHRRRGQLPRALRALERAVALEARIEGVVNPAGTHLNVCAVLSQLGRHTVAIEHARAALVILQAELFGEDGESVADRPDRMAVLAIAFHNLGVEQEFLHRGPDCLASYTKARDVAKAYLGEGHDITAQMNAALKGAEAKMGKNRGKQRPKTAKK
eukprot:TRINITY_DN773_c1_g1_i2.p2 TRINITY_DN773_c1_g1~~TRINITY_DN773_c1_g1_i2.p2  ORF type:complete len:278 (+),score=47.63 TRINITY_DN773_c1_g1_i2:310-1143(+)